MGFPDFMKENEFALYILGISLLFFVLLLIIPSANGNENKKGATPKLNTQTAIIESMTDADIEKQKMKKILNENADRDIENLNMTNPEDSFCEIHKGKSNELEGLCGKLSSANCNLTSCCVYLNKKEGKDMCVAGDMNGPTYKTDKTGSLITMDSYYYKNKLYKK